MFIRKEYEKFTFGAFWRERVDGATLILIIPERKQCFGNIGGPYETRII